MPPRPAPTITNKLGKNFVITKLEMRFGIKASNGISHLIKFGKIPPGATFKARYVAAAPFSLTSVSAVASNKKATLELVDARVAGRCPFLPGVLPAPWAAVGQVVTFGARPCEPGQSVELTFRNAGHVPARMAVMLWGYEGQLT